MSVRRSGEGIVPPRNHDGDPVGNGILPNDPAEVIGFGDQREVGTERNQQARVCEQRVPFSSASHQSLEKLKGRDDYAAWAFGMRMVMIKEGTWRAVNSVDDVQISEDLSDRALATICLSIERYNYSLVQNARTAKEAWTSLRTAFQDSGKYRKISLLRKLMRLELEDCSSVEEYVDEILTTSQKLQEIGFPLDDEWMSLILMMGLPKRYEPMVMGMDASGVKWTADWVKSKILQDVTIEPGARAGGSSGALATCPKQTQRKKDKSNMRCFKCEKLGHYASECQQRSANFKSEKSCRNMKKKALLACKTQNRPTEDWILDSGAGDHMCNNNDSLVGAKEVSQSIYVADASEIAVVAVGNVELDSDVDGECCSLDISDVLCVPDLAVNLLSVSRICKKGYCVNFTSESCVVKHEATGEIIAKGYEKDGLYRLNQVHQPTACVARAATNLELWHRRLGHLNIESVKRLSGMVTGMKIQNGTMSPCVPCVEAKHQRSPFKSSGSRASGVLEVVHSDVCGAMEKPSLGGNRYFVTFIDDASRMTFVYFLKSKKEAFEAFKEFKAYSETQTGRKLKCLRTDNGGEYVGKHFEEFLKTNGIRHETTVPHNPEQNGLAERMNRTIQERARCLMFDGKLDKRFWAEAASTAVYLINRSPTKGIPVTPFEKFTGRKPDISNLRVFGSRAMAYVPKVKRAKWDPKSEPCILIGYSECSKAYRVYNPKSKQVFESRDVVILDESQVGEVSIPADSNTTIEPIFFEEVNQQEIMVRDQELPVPDDVQHDDKSSRAEGASDNMTMGSVLEEPLDPQQPLALPSQFSQNPTMRRSERERRFKGKYTDIKVTYSVLPKELSIPQNECRDGRVSQLGSQECIPQVPVSKDPETVQEALCREDRAQWIEAMESEYRALCANETWCLVDLPKGRKALKNKWIFKIKAKPDGTIERYKARLVIKGFSQIKGVDYCETYSPVVRYATIRHLLALAAQLNLIVYQMDAVTAFLQGDLDDEEIYMEQPEGFQDKTASRKVCKLKKALYGLKQASRVWNTKLNQKLERIGLKRSKYDTCVYHKVANGKLIIVAVYVDDLLLFSNDQRLVDDVKRQLCAEFQMKDLGEARQILGLRVTRTDGAISIDQEKYIEELLEKFSMTDCNPVMTPMDANQRLLKTMSPRNEEGKEKMKQIPFRELIGGLQFVAQCTRPDISHAVSIVSSFCSDPGMPHWTAAKRILRYLKGTKQCKLTYRRDADSKFSGYTDADWANDPETRRSVSGYVFIQSGGAVSWSSKRQATVALSTTEAEYMALSMVTQEAVWWKGFLRELYGINDSVVIKCDNKSSICLAERDMGYSARTKHIDVRHHFVREQVEAKAIKLEHVASNFQAADILTKALPGLKLHEDRKILGVLQMPT